MYKKTSFSYPHPPHIAPGIIGYMFIEGWSPLDSIYMTIITLSTVGCEIHDIEPGGRIFIVILILFSIIIIYMVGLVAKTLIEGEIRPIFGRRKLGKKLSV